MNTLFLTSVPGKLMKQIILSVIHLNNLKMDFNLCRAVGNADADDAAPLPNYHGTREDSQNLFPQLCHWLAS